MGGSSIASWVSRKVPQWRPSIALTLDPANPDAASGASVIAAKLGRFEEAVALARRAVETDPLNPEVVGSLGQLYYDMGRLLDPGERQLLPDAREVR